LVILREVCGEENANVLIVAYYEEGRGGRRDSGPNGKGKEGRKRGVI
jgi:hypothetical protein